MEYLALQAVVLPEDLAAANLPADSAIIAISPQFFPLKRGGKDLQLSAAFRQTLLCLRSLRAPSQAKIRLSPVDFITQLVIPFPNLS